MRVDGHRLYVTLDSVPDKTILEVVVADPDGERTFDERASVSISREKYRAIKSFGRQTLERYLMSVYRNGYRDGSSAAGNAAAEIVRTAAQADDEIHQVDWEDVLAVIGQVRGVTDDLLVDIDNKLREVF